MDKLQAIRQLQNASAKELKEAQDRVAMKDPDHLTRWLQETRPYIVFKSSDLVESLKPLWPDGIQAFQNVVNCYRSHRCAIPSGETKTAIAPNGEEYVQALYKDDALTMVELDRCIRFLVGQILEHNSDWSLEDTAL